MEATRKPNGHFITTKGKPPGARNRLQGKFLKALHDDFEKEGEGVIKIVRMEKPVEYLRIIASVLPKEFLFGETGIEDLTDEDLRETLELIRQRRTLALPAPSQEQDTAH